MAFTDRFIKLPVTLLDRKQSELLGDDNAPEFESYIKLLPMEISNYRPAHDDDDNEKPETELTMKNGVEIVIPLSVEELEKRLNNHG